MAKLTNVPCKAMTREIASIGKCDMAKTTMAIEKFEMATDNFEMMSPHVVEDFSCIEPMDKFDMGQMTMPAHIVDEASLQEIPPRAVAKMSRPSYVVAGPKLPRGIPAGFELASNEAAFDPAVHLSMEIPTAVWSSDFERFPFPHSAKSPEGFKLGYCEPFRLLSEEGVQVLRGIMEANEVHAKSNERIPKCLRGLAYRSQFVRDLTYSPEVLELVSQLAGKPLAPHGMPMNIGHTNWGRKVNGENGEEAVIVDQWHVDSVDYVMVLILSDLSKMVGGDLEVLHKAGVRDNAEFLQAGIGPDMQKHVRKVAYPGAGYCIFMHGSQILHRVSPISFADEARISCVTSYMSRNVFDEDSTRFHTFKHQDPEHVSAVEYARHQAWRVGGVMEYLQEKLKFGTPTDEISGVLRDAASTLEKAARLVDGTENDQLAWIDQKTVQAKFESPVDLKVLKSNL